MDGGYNNRYEVGIDVFEDALSKLDKKLGMCGREMSIKAIGGFALICHGIRTYGYTVDIDSLTAPYPPEVDQLIAEVADELGLERYWINTEPVFGMEPEYAEAEAEVVWEETSSLRPLKNISLVVADKESLLRCKVMAMDTAELNAERRKDLPDAIDICNALGVDQRSLDSAFPGLRYKYPDGFRRLQEANWDEKSYRIDPVKEKPRGIDDALDAAKLAYDTYASVDSFDEFRLIDQRGLGGRML